MMTYNYLYYRAVHVFFKEWKHNNLSKEQASLHSSKIVYDKGSYKAKQIRIWAKGWVEHGILPKSLQGCHQKIKSIIDDEDAIEQSLLFIREKGGKITPKQYQTFVKQVLFLQLKDLILILLFFCFRKIGPQLVFLVEYKLIYFGFKQEDSVISVLKSIYGSFFMNV